MDRHWREADVQDDMHGPWAAAAATQQATSPPHALEPPASNLFLRSQANASSPGHASAPSVALQPGPLPSGPAAKDQRPVAGSTGSPERTPLREGRHDRSLEASEQHKHSHRRHQAAQALHRRDGAGNATDLATPPASQGTLERHAGEVKHIQHITFPCLNNASMTPEHAPCSTARIRR